MTMRDIDELEAEIRIEDLTDDDVDADGAPIGDMLEHDELDLVQADDDDD